MTLGRYEVVKHLAQGGMAEVLLARTKGIEGFERHVVIKRIRVEQARDDYYIRMLLDEARLTATLHHHNIVQVNDIGEDSGEYFFAMDYVHGRDAHQLLTEVSRKGWRVPLDHVVTIVTAAAAGLHHAHEQRGADRTPLAIVHRDVSPGNILIGYDGGVKVADFGIAKAACRTSRTQSGTLKGKAGYMSPEQCLSKPVDRRSDVYGLGIVLYELATTQRLFKRENDYLTMKAIVDGDIPRPSSRCPEIAGELEAIILKALARSPGDRYATADEMRLALEQFATRTGLQTSTTALADYMKQQFGDCPEPWLADDDDPEIEIVHPPPAGARRRRAWPIGLGAAAVIAVALSGVPRAATEPTSGATTRVAAPPIAPVVAPPPTPDPPIEIEMSSRIPAAPAKRRHHARPTTGPTPKPEVAESPKRWDPAELFPE